MNRRQLLGTVPFACLTSPWRLVAQQRSRRDVPWLEEVQRAPARVPDDVPRLASPMTTRTGMPISDLRAWQVRRGELRKWWLDFLGSLKRPLQPPALRVLDEEQLGNVVRQRVSYEAAAGWTTEAYLLKPAKLTPPVPGVVVFHSTVEHSIRQPAGVEGKPEKAFGLRLAERGYVTFCPRNFLWPTNRQIQARAQAELFLARHRDCKGMAKMLLDGLVAVDILTSLSDVDGERIGAVGHSLGAKEVLYLAAFDERIRVAVSSEGGIGTRFSNWDAPWYLGPTIKLAEFTHEHHELLALIAPRPFLLIGGDSADGDRSWPFIAAALPAYQLYGRTPRLGLLNHKQGHAVPPVAQRRIEEWFEAYL